MKTSKSQSIGFFFLCYYYMRKTIGRESSENFLGLFSIKLKPWAWGIYRRHCFHCYYFYILSLYTRLLALQRPCGYRIAPLLLFLLEPLVHLSIWCSRWADLAPSLNIGLSFLQTLWKLKRCTQDLFISGSSPKTANVWGMKQYWGYHRSSTHLSNYLYLAEAHCASHTSI